MKQIKGYEEEVEEGVKRKGEKEREMKHDKQCTVQGRKEERPDKGKGRRRNKGKGRKGIMGEEEEGARKTKGGREGGGRVRTWEQFDVRTFYLFRIFCLGDTTPN